LAKSGLALENGRRVYGYRNCKEGHLHLIPQKRVFSLAFPHTGLIGGVVVSVKNNLWNGLVSVEEGLLLGPLIKGHNLNFHSTGNGQGSKLITYKP